MRYDGIRAHVKKQHPDVELPKRFFRNLIERSADPRSVELVPRSVINQTGERFFYSGFFIQVTLKNTDHCVSTDLCVFDCIPITVCPIYSLTSEIILFKNCEFGFFYLT